MAVSIIDVAKEAGVSKSTVSRVLTGGSVKPATKERIQKAIDKLGYVPNVVAQGLRGKRDTGIVGVYMPYHESMKFGLFDIGSSGFYTLLRGIERVLIPEGFDLLFIYDSLKEAGSVPKYMDYFAQNRMDALFSLGVAGDEGYLKKAYEKYGNVVYTGKPIEGLDAFNMYMSYMEYNLEIYEYLYLKGHSHIISVTDTQPQLQIHGRKKEAYSLFSRHTDVPDMDESILYTYDGSSLKDGIVTLIDKGYTAIYAEDIFVLNQIMPILYEMNLKVGEDLSVIVVEHGHNIREAYPDMTTMEIPYDRVGKICGEQILHAIRGIDGDDRQVTIMPKIIEKQSVIDLNQGGI